MYVRPNGLTAKRRKKRRQDRNAEQRTATITFEAVKRYTYSGFMMMTAFLLCIYVGSSPRKAAKSLEVFNFMFHGLLGDSPCHTTIRTWLAKMGLDAIKHKDRTLDEAYISLSCQGMPALWRNLMK